MFAAVALTGFVKYLPVSQNTKPFPPYGRISFVNYGDSDHFTKHLHLSLIHISSILLHKRQLLPKAVVVLNIMELHITLTFHDGPRYELFCPRCIHAEHVLAQTVKQSLHDIEPHQKRKQVKLSLIHISMQEFSA